MIRATILAVMLISLAGCTTAQKFTAQPMRQEINGINYAIRDTEDGFIVFSENRRFQIGHSKSAMERELDKTMRQAALRYAGGKPVTSEVNDADFDHGRSWLLFGYAGDVSSVTGYRRFYWEQD